MPKISNKPNKNLYMSVREDLGLSREKASVLIENNTKYKLSISADRLEKLENGRVQVHPYEILSLAEAYRSPALINYYCTNDCDIGKNHINRIISKELSQIAIETLNSLNRLNQARDRLLEIVEDGTITEDEYDDFIDIKTNLDKISHAVESLQLWLDDSVANGKIPFKHLSR